MTPEELATRHAAAFETPRPWSTAEFAALLEARETFLVTHSHGFALGRIIVDEAELLTLAVDPRKRRSGIGRKLVEAFETQAVSRKAEYAFLEVAAGNTAARALYQVLGYREAGLRKGYYRRPDGSAEDAFIYRHTLL